jgi:hypothetical protein
MWILISDSFFLTGICKNDAASQHWYTRIIAHEHSQFQVHFCNKHFLLANVTKFINVLSGSGPKYSGSVT